MNTYSLDFFGIKRELPIIPISPKIKVPSISLLGDVQLTEIAATKLAEKLSSLEIDYLVGPEVKVVPLLFSLSQHLHKDRFIVCRKGIKGYMTNPLILYPANPSESLVIDGPDRQLISDKNIAIIDDVVSSGTTINNISTLLEKAGARVIATAAIFKQGDRYQESLIYLSELPIFDKI